MKDVAKVLGVVCTLIGLAMGKVLAKEYPIVGYLALAFIAALFLLWGAQTAWSAITRRKGK